MEIETLNIRSSAIKVNDLLPFSFQTSGFPEIIHSMRQSASWMRGELISRILLVSPDKQIVLTILHEKTEVNSYQSKDSLKIRIIEGKVQFNTSRDSVILYEGQVLTLYEKVKYRITTLEDTVFLLTISNKSLNAPEPLETRTRRNS